MANYMTNQVVQSAYQPVLLFNGLLFSAYEFKVFLNLFWRPRYIKFYFRLPGQRLLRLNQTRELMLKRLFLLKFKLIVCEEIHKYSFKIDYIFPQPFFRLKS